MCVQWGPEMHSWGAAFQSSRLRLKGANDLHQITMSLLFWTMQIIISSVFVLRAIAIWVSEGEVIVLSFTGRWCLCEQREIDYQHWRVFTSGPVWPPLLRPACLSNSLALNCVCFPTLCRHHKSDDWCSELQRTVTHAFVIRALTDFPLLIFLIKMENLGQFNRKIPLLNSESKMFLYAAKMHSLNIH